MKREARYGKNRRKVHKIRVFGLDRIPGYLREEIQRGKLKEKAGKRA